VPSEIPSIIGNDANLVLPPGRYPGDLVIEGDENQVTGAGAGETIIEGRLSIDGGRNRISDLTVCGRSRVKGHHNSVDGVEFKRGVSGTRNWAPLIFVAFPLAVVAFGLAVGFGPRMLIRSCAGEPPKNGFELPEWAQVTTRSSQPLFASASGFVEELGAGRHEAAYARMSTPYRKVMTLDRFREAVTAHPYLGAARRVTVRKVSMTGDQIGQATGFLQTSAGSVDVAFHYSRESEGWKITGVSIGGAPALLGQASTAAVPGKAPAPPRPAPAGCGKDTDCKGDRICVTGACVAPR
jgi:hypothetical protein